MSRSCVCLFLRKRSAPNCYNGGMRFRGFIRGTLCLLGLTGALVPNTDAQATELSHTERFSRSSSRLEDVERDASAVLAGVPEDVNALLSRARVRIQLGKTEQALSDFERASALAPARADVRAQLALAYLQLNRLTDAKFSADAALAIQPENSAANYTVGLLLLAATTDIGGAIQYLERGVLGNPVSPEVRFDLLRAYARSGDRLRTHVQLRVLQALLPANDARILHGQGLLASLNGNLDEAVAKFREANGAKPELPSAPMEGALAIARALLEKGESGQAMTLFRQAVSRFPQSIEAHQGLAAALEKTGQATAANAEHNTIEQLSRKLGVGSSAATPRKP